MIHSTKPVKVNAWVDKEIAPVVQALNKFTEIITVDSCQGGDGQNAYVHFICNSNDDALYHFVKDTSRMLSQNISCSDGFCLRIEWVAGSDYPMATLSMEPNMIGPLSKAMESAVFNGDHKNPFSGDTKHREPHSSRAS